MTLYDIEELTYDATRAERIEAAIPWKELLEGIIRDIWAKYGPFAALLILFIVFHTIYTHRQWIGQLKDKDKEIDRLVEERNRLQESIIQKRISSKKDKDS